MINNLNEKFLIFYNILKLWADYTDIMLKSTT
jgi:hypothetical protein